MCCIVVNQEDNHVYTPLYKKIFIVNKELSSTHHSSTAENNNSYIYKLTKEEYTSQLKTMDNLKLYSYLNTLEKDKQSDKLRNLLEERIKVAFVEDDMRVADSFLEDWSVAVTPLLMMRNDSGVGEEEHETWSAAIYRNVFIFAGKNSFWYASRFFRSLLEAPLIMPYEVHHVVFAE